MAKTKGFWVEKSPNIRFINQKGKGHSTRNEKENRATEEAGSNKHCEVKLPLKSRDELPPILMALQHIYVSRS